MNGFESTKIGSQRGYYNNPVRDNDGLEQGGSGGGGEDQIDPEYNFELVPIGPPSRAILKVVGNIREDPLFSLHHEFLPSYCIKAISIQTHSSNSYLKISSLLILYTCVAISFPNKSFAKKIFWQKNQLYWLHFISHSLFKKQLY